MKVYPVHIEQKLGFDLLRQKLDAYTISRMGQERVETMQPSDRVAEVGRGLKQVVELQAILAFDDAFSLGALPDIREVVMHILPEDAFMQPEGLLGVAHILAGARLVRSYLSNRQEKYPHLQVFAQELVPIKSLEDRIHQVVDDQGRVKDDASPELRRIRRAILRAQQELRGRVMDELRRAQANGYTAEDQPTIRNGRMVIPVKAEAKRKVQGFLHDISATGQTAYIEPAAVLELNNDIRELETEEVREIERILRAVCAELRVHVPTVVNNTETLGLFDFQLAKAKLGNVLGGMMPDLNEKGIFKLRQAKNPGLVLRHARDKRAIVPLDLELGKNFRTLIITGPNAGGKSVAMKTVGLLALMLSYGLTIPVNGDASDCCLFSQIFADIGDEQSIENDLSTFSSHLSHLRFMLAAANEGTLILIDEAGTGTDPTEGAALSQAMLEHFHHVGARTIVTTHHGALKVFAHETEGVENGAMQFDQATITPTYRLQVGIPGSSYAFEMANRLEIPRGVIERARGLVGTQQTSLENLLHTFSKRNLALERQLKSIENERKQAQEARQKFEEQRQHLQNIKDQVRADALRAAQQVMDEANAQIERTIREIKEAQAEAERTKAARAQLEATKETIRKYQENLEKRKKVENQRKEAKPVLKAKPASTPMQATPIQVGDQVVVTGGSTAAEVIEIEGKHALIVQGAMKMRVKLAELKKVGGPKQQQVTVRTTYNGASNFSTINAAVRLDVRGFRVEDAKITVLKFLDDAVTSGLNRVEILHGTGTGALRMSIKDLLTHYPDATRFEDAPWDQGGPGVTYIWFD